MRDLINYRKPKSNINNMRHTIGVLEFHIWCVLRYGSFQTTLSFLALLRKHIITNNVAVVYMGRYEVVLRGELSPYKQQYIHSYIL